jgi:hypothetical protein
MFIAGKFCWGENPPGKKGEYVVVMRTCCDTRHVIVSDWAAATYRASSAGQSE